MTHILTVMGTMHVLPPFFSTSAGTVCVVLLGLLCALVVVQCFATAVRVGPARYGAAQAGGADGGDLDLLDDLDGDPWPNYATVLRVPRTTAR